MPTSTDNQATQSKLASDFQTVEADVEKASGFSWGAVAIVAVVANLVGVFFHF